MRKLLLCCVVLLLVGCSDSEVALRVGALDMYEVYLSDGTRCAVFSSYNKGGITCDWSGPKSYKRNFIEKF